MNSQKVFISTLRIILLSLLLTLLSSYGGIYDSSAFAEEDLFETLQAITFPEPEEAPDFSLKSLDGTTKSLEDYKGSLLFLNFWTTW